MDVRQVTLIAATLAYSIATPAFAPLHPMVGRDTFPSAQREYALHGKLYDHGPTSAPASSGCTWGQIQTPTGEGLKWMVEEQCQQSSGMGSFRRCQPGPTPASADCWIGPL